LLVKVADICPEGRFLSDNKRNCVLKFAVIEDIIYLCAAKMYHEGDSSIRFACLDKGFEAIGMNNLNSKIDR